MDNDSDGRVDYPNDPGCSSATDNDEYDQVTAQCVIDSFYASPTNVTSGGYTTLSWSTTGCDYVTIDGVTYPIDGSGSSDRSTVDEVTTSSYSKWSSTDTFCICEC